MEFAIVPFKVLHKRFSPKSYKFEHRFFWFKINLFNLGRWPTKFVGINQSSLYSFFDSDHLKLGMSSAKDNYIQFAKQNGLQDEVVEISLYTSFRFLGYVFNPVSFALLKDVTGKHHAIIEIGNTFNEQKPFFVSHESFKREGFVFKTKKMFYISPFLKHDNEMTFVFKKENEKISIFIDDQDQDQSVLKVWFNGEEKKATTSELLKQTAIVPFVTLKTIFLIHYHALILWMKGIKYFKKDEHKDLQQEFYLWKTPKHK
ncbi:MAG: DUF1365 domain-containing protein [Bacteriovoracaceae bacterium]